MFRIAMKNVLARKGRLLLTAMAVIASCTFLSGVFVFSDTIRASFDRLFANAYAQTDAFVRSPNIIEGDFGANTRGRLPDTVLDKIRAVPGVAEASGEVQGFARVSTSSGKQIGIDGPPKFGGAFSAEKTSPWKLDEGRIASGPDEVVIDKRSAKDGNIKVGDMVTVTAKAAKPFKVVGIVTFAGSDTSGGATWALFDLKTAQEFVIGEPGLLDAVSVKSDGSVSDAQLKGEIQKLFDTKDIEVLTGAEITAKTQSEIAKGIGFFTTFLTIFAAIALLVGSFVIYNVFRITSAQRQQDNALMRAIGAYRSQVVKAQFIEAGIVGIIGAILGFAGGVGLATLILKILGAVGQAPSDTSLAIQPASFVITFVVGVVVTLLCATLPAIRAGRVPPLAAMRAVSIDRSGLSRKRLAVGGVFSVIAVVGIILGFKSDAKWLGVGVVGLFTSLIAFGPLVVGPLAKLLTKPLGKLRGVTGEIAGRNASRSPERTALTAAALGIGLALLVGVATLGSSIQSSIRTTVGNQFTGDFTISSPDAGNFGGLPTKLADDLNTVPQVKDAVGVGAGLLQIVEKGKPSAKVVLAVDPAHAEGLYDVGFIAGGWSNLDASSIVVSKAKADRDHLTIGSLLDIVFVDKSTTTLTVAGIFSREDFGNLIVDRTVFKGHGDVYDRQIIVQSKPGVSPTEAKAAIRVVTDKYASSKLQTRSEFIDDQVAAVDGFLNFIYALLLMSVFIAVLGIVLTLLLAVYERRRELGLVRAIGMTRPQVRGSIRWEAILTALLGAIMGTGLGLTLGWIVVSALRDKGLNTFSVAPVSIAAFAFLAIVFAVIAAWIPARNAAKSDILQAIATT